VQQATITILDPVGLHARPAAVLVQTAGRYQARVRLVHGDRRADARSIIQLLSLGVRQGSAILVTAEGTDEDEALAAVLAVLTAPPEPGHPAPPEPVTPGTASSPGSTSSTSSNASTKKESDDEKADQ
jgi:phosphotransferase system HPr (HPr) family protein